MEKTEKLPFGEWCENLWYRYKWLIIILALIVVFLIIAAVQWLSADDPDITVLFVGPEYLTTESRSKLYTSMEKFAADIDGDGKVTTDILDITLKRAYDISDPDYYVTYDQNNEALKRFEAEIRVGDALIYILDRTYFDKCVELGVLAKLSDVLGAEPENSVGGCGFVFGDLDVSTLPGFDAIPKDMIICLRRSPDEDVIDYGRKTDFWENNRKAFASMAAYKA